MTEYISPFTKARTGKIVFILSVLVCLFWFLGQGINVYHFPIVSAVFEILWFPAVALTIGLPILSFIFWSKEKFTIRSLYPYSILIVVAAVLIMIFRK
jgi:hypothetical protein